MADYCKLKSGTDIRGKAMGDDAVLTADAVRDFARAFALWLTKRTGKERCKIAIGRDSRLTGGMFADAVISALRPAGQDIIDCGLFSTPAAYTVTQLPSVMADGSIMITASHHPKEINGLKFFTADGGVNSAELDEIISLAEAGESIGGEAHSTVVRRECLRLYSNMLADVIRKGTGLYLPLKNMKIAVDAGHGAGGFFATNVLAPLGADVSCSQFLTPDGNFPVHSPNPENKEAMDSLRTRVLSTGADLGVIFDADVDRCAIVAHDGTEINRCSLIALASAVVLSETPGATIVTDSVTTEGLRTFIESKGGVQLRFKRGYRNVIDEAKRLNDMGIDAPLAIESSGHAAFREHYFLDDGAYFIAKILVVMSALRRKKQNLTDLIADLHKPLEEADIRLKFTDAGWRGTAEKIVSRLTALSERLLNVSNDNYEGVRAYLNNADGYFIVRTSVHDPVLPIYIEADKRGGTLKIAKFLYSFLSGFRGLDCAPLTEFIADGEAQREADEADAEAIEIFESDADELENAGYEQYDAAEISDDESVDDSIGFDPSDAQYESTSDKE